MKKLIILFLSVCFFVTNGFSQINAGVGSTFIIDGTTPGVQAKLVVNASEKWRVGPTFSYYLDSGLDWAIDADVSYELINISDAVNIFPMAGLNFSKYTGDSDIGINIGVFSDFPIADDKFRIYIEPKYRVSDSSSFIASAGILF